MLFIYDRVVEKLKKDSIQRYEERKENYRRQNNFQPEEEEKIVVKRMGNDKGKSQRTIQNNVRVDERPLRPKQQSLSMGNNQKIEKVPQRNYDDVPIKPQLQPSQPSSIKPQEIPINPQTIPSPSAPSQQPPRPIKPLQTSLSQQPNQIQQVKLVMCPEGCQRRFAPAALQKHIKYCKKVFQTKRDPVNLQEKRTQEFQKVAVSKSSEVVPKKSNYKAESQYFQCLMRRQKGEELTEEDKAMMKAHEDSKLEECKGCKKKMAPGRMESHLKACAKMRK